MNFGVSKTTAFIDDNNSILSIEKKYHSGGEVARPIRKYFEINTKVHTERELHEWFLNFVKDVLNDKTKLDASIEFRHTKHGDEQGYYLAIACYTVLEY
jgi:transcription termination factor NusB